MCTVDTDLLRETANVLNRTGRDLVNCCNSDCRSILNELDRIASKYRDYSSVTSKVSAIRADINDILNLSRELEDKNQNLVAGLRNAEKMYREGEREAKSVVTQDKATAFGKVGSRIRDKMPTPIRNASIQDIDIKSQDDAIKYVTELEQNTEEIEMYTAILNNYRSSGQGQPQWLLDKLEELGAPYGVIKKGIQEEPLPSYTYVRGVTIKNEEDARKYVKQLEENTKEIEMYTAILNNYRSSGQGQPQWVLDKLEELGAPYGIIEQTIIINGVIIPKTNKIGDLKAKETDQYIKLLLNECNGKVKNNFHDMIFEFEGDLENEEDYNRAIELYVATKGYNTNYELLGKIDKEDQKKILLYWLSLEKQGKDIKDAPIPKWWEERKEEAFGKIEVTEENYYEATAEYYDCYRAYNYLIPETISYEKFMDWYMEPYGHLDPDGHNIQRVKYKLAQAGIIDLKNEKGFYDNTSSKEYLASLDLFLNLYGCYDEFYQDIDILRRSSEKYLIEKLEQVCNNELEIKYIRDENIEKNILEGKYIMFDDSVAMIDTGLIGNMSIDGDTVTLTTTFQYMEDPNSVEERTVTYSFKLEYIEYAGKQYIDSEAFEKVVRGYIIKKGEEGYYKNQWINVWSDKDLLDTALDLKKKIEEEHPELKLTEEQAITLLCQQMEMDKLMNRQKMTNTEFYQDAAQQVIDGLATISALTGHPVIAGALELVNIAGDVRRYNYDDATLRSALLVADVVAGLVMKGINVADVELDEVAKKKIAEADEVYLYSKRNGHKLSGDEWYQSYLKIAADSDIPPAHAKELNAIGANVDEGIEGGSQTRLIPGQEGVVTGGDSTKLGKNMMESMELPRNTKWSGYQAQHVIPAEMADHPVIQKIGMDLDDASNGLFLRTPADDISTMSRHRGYHSTYNEFVKTQLDAIDITQSTNILQQQVLDLQINLKKLQQSGLPLYPSQGATVDLWQRSLERIK